MSNYINKILLLISASLMLGVTYSETVVTFRDNGNADISISRNNYNRILVAQDKITNIRFPRQNLAAEKDIDGSIYVDALDDRPFTIFFTTQKGHHFSATVKVREDYGQTIKFVQKRVPPRLLKKRVVQVNPIKELLKHTGSESDFKGYQKDTKKGGLIRVQRGLVANQIFSLKSKELVSTKYILRNVSNKPINLDKNNFKDIKTKGLLLGASVIYPNQEMSLVRAEEVSHGKV